MTHSDRCIDLVKSFEGCSLVSYEDGNGIETIGYGHTHNVKKGDTCTIEQATEWLNSDLESSDNALARLAPVPLDQNQYDALVSLIFNIGQGRFSHSTVLDKLIAGDYPAAANAILMWNKVAGQVSAGLVRRRNAERALFMEDL